MATQLQIEANRKNAQKSTGPRTPEGKEASSQNALKHGLCANKNVIRTESQEEYNLFRDEMIADIAPAGAMELMLAERIVSLSWRLKRAEHFQNAVIEALIESGLHESVLSWPSDSSYRARKEAETGNIDIVLGIVVNKDFANHKTLENLLAYEHRIESSLYKAIAELKKMQQLRRMRDKEEDMVCTAHTAATRQSDTQDKEMKDETRETIDEGRGIMDEEKETEEVCNEEVSLNEANPYPATCDSSLVNCFEK